MSGGTIRVLHTIDGLTGGGSERWVLEIVRLSDPVVVRHRVVPIHPDFGRFAYAARLQALGALGRPRISRRQGRRYRAQLDGSARARLTPSGGPARRLASLPASLRNIAIQLWHNGAVFPAAAVRLAIECARFRPNVIHAHTFHGLVAGLVLRRVLGRPLVHTVPSFFKHMTDNGFSWVPGVYARYHQSIDIFITNYPAELLGIGVPPSKIEVCRGMADVAAISSLRSHRDSVRRDLCEGIGIDLNSFIGISVGRLAPEKGHEFAIRALPTILRSVPNFHWVVLGDGDLKPPLIRLARECNVDSHVHFIGFVDDPLPWYIAADLYLRTNILEGDNLSSVQAMAAALPVVGFDTESDAELVHEVGHGIVVENRNSIRFADAVCRLTTAADRREIGERGAAYATLHFSNHLVIRACQDIYRKLAASPAIGSP